MDLRQQFCIRLQKARLACGYLARNFLQAYAPGPRGCLFFVGKTLDSEVSCRSGSRVAAGFRACTGPWLRNESCGARRGAFNEHPGWRAGAGAALFLLRQALYQTRRRGCPAHQAPAAGSMRHTRCDPPDASRNRPGRLKAVLPVLFDKGVNFQRADVGQRCLVPFTRQSQTAISCKASACASVNRRLMKRAGTPPTTV